MPARKRRDHGEGTVRNRGTERNPKWFAYYWVDIEPEPMLDKDGTPKLDADGRPRMRTRRQVSEGPFFLKADALAWLKKEVRAKDEGRARVPTSKTVGDMLDEWLDIRRHALSPNTFREYQRMAEQRIRPHLGTVKVKDLGPAHIARMFAALREPGANRRGKAKLRLSETSLQHTYGVLRSACGWAIRQRWISFNPCDDVERPTREDVEMKAWTAGQLGTFLVADKVADDRLFPLWRTASHTGARRSELLGLLWPDVDLDAGTIFVRRRRIKVGAEMVERESTKTKRGKRYVDLDPLTVAVLKRWRKAQRAERLAWGPAWAGSDRPGEQGHVFTTENGAALHADHVAHRFERLVFGVDVPVLRFHELRHTHATLLLKAGRPLHEVARRLGHSEAVCLSRYGHLVDGQAAEGAAVFANLVDGAL